MKKKLVIGVNRKLIADFCRKELGCADKDVYSVSRTEQLRGLHFDGVSQVVVLTHTTSPKETRALEAMRTILASRLPTNRTVSITAHQFGHWPDERRGV